LNGIQEVSGSIPLISTKKETENVSFWFFFLLFSLFGGGITRSHVSQILRFDSENPSDLS
jgi:hypothetical protein